MHNQRQPQVADNPRLKTKKWSILIKISALMMLSILLVIVVGYVMMTYAPSLNIQAWFAKTRLIWLAWRLCLYAIIIALIWHIRRHTPVSSAIWWMTLLALLLIEGLNWLYLLG